MGTPPGDDRLFRFVQLFFFFFFSPFVAGLASGEGRRWIRVLLYASSDNRGFYARRGVYGRRVAAPLPTVACAKGGGRAR